MVYLINPGLTSREGDSHSSGIPYLPIGLAYLSSVLEKKSIEHRVIDAFAEGKDFVTKIGPFLTFGLHPSEITKRLSHDRCDAILIYANSVFNTHSVFEISRALSEHIKAPIFLAENTQAVTGFSILKCIKGIQSSGVTHVLLGEGEAILPEVFEGLLSHGCVPKHLSCHVWSPGDEVEVKKSAMVGDLDSIPYPNWKRFPLSEYWALGYGHGPVSGKYISMLTSKGCPYPCGFCSVPVMNKQIWRKRSANSVVDEMQYFTDQLSLDEIHWEDLNPTIDEKRMIEISNEIIRRKLKVSLKIVSGTKMDNLKIETLERMAEAGLKYISFSPESGSEEVLKKIRKPFRHTVALRQVQRLHSLGIRTQACFVLGFPGEAKKDRLLTSRYSRQLIRAGVDELTYFIVAPMPGTPIEGDIEGKRENLADLTFSPSWRLDFKELVRWRDRLYMQFFILKFIHYPLGVMMSCFRAFRGRCILKMEMLPRRWLRGKLLELKLIAFKARPLSQPLESQC